MKNNKIIVRINNLNEIAEYKKVGIVNFLFALDEFSIGYQTFNIDEINDLNENCYLLINRVFDSISIQDFKDIIPKLNNIKGIFFEDLGVYNLLKDSNIPLIWDQAHFVLNSKSINFWLNKVSSASLSNELTLEEIQYILDKVSKPIVLPVFGYNVAMYSRRLLISNYNKYKELNTNHQMLLKINENLEFLARENQYGTILFYNHYFNYIPKIKELNDDQILLYYINPMDLKPDDIINIVNGGSIESMETFLNKKTIYKLEDLR